MADGKSKEWQSRIGTHKPSESDGEVDSPVRMASDETTGADGAVGMGGETGSLCCEQFGP